MEGGEGKQKGKITVREVEVLDLSQKNERGRERQMEGNRRERHVLD